MIECKTCKNSDLMDGDPMHKILICMKYKGSVCGNRKNEYPYYEPIDDFISEKEMKI